jgi:hypothetical protein
MASSITFGASDVIEQRATHTVPERQSLQDKELVAQREDLRVLSRLLIGSSRSSANTFVMPR